MTKQIILLFSTVPLFATLSTEVNQNTETPIESWAFGKLILLLLLFLAFFSKKQKTDNRSNNSSIEDSNRQQNSEKKELAPGRTQHYKFVHVVLKDMFFENRDNLIKNILSSEDELKGLWLDVGHYYSKQYEGVEDIDGSDIKITAKEFEDILFVVIALPEPKETVEAYFIGLIVPRLKKKKSRYITLEKGEEGTVLCEWTKEMHLNFGEGPEPTLDNFQDKLIDMGDVSVKTWNDAKPVYLSETWMNILWEWADQYDISPLVLPRNSKDLEALERLSISFEEKKPEYLPKEIGYLYNLHTFIMYDSKIKELPDEFSNLINLKYLYLDGNELTKLPDTFCKLTNLEKVSLSYNNITSLPDCIGKLQHLESLNLNFNLLKELPESMLELKLKELRLLENPVEYISKEVQDFLNTTKKADASAKEPFTIVWKFGEETHEYAKQFNIPDFGSSLPFFLSGKEVESDDNFLLTQRHLLLGILYGLNEELPIAAVEEVLINLVDILSEGFGFETLEEMILDVSTRVRDINGTTPSWLILETGHRLVPQSSKILEHLILDLWFEVSFSKDNLALLEAIPVWVEKIDLSAIHPYSKQLVCYYGLCALIFINQANSKDYLESDLVDNYIKKYFYPNVLDTLLLNKAVAFMENPENFYPIDMMNPMA